MPNITTNHAITWYKNFIDRNRQIFERCICTYTKVSFKLDIDCILGDPEAVSRVGRKGGTKVFKNGRKSPWVRTVTELFPKIQADAGS